MVKAASRKVQLRKRLTGGALDSNMNACARYDEGYCWEELEAGRTCLAWQANNDDAGRMDG
jgi:hypothetical protein